MISYRIGKVAEKIVAVKIDLEGNVTPIVRRRLADGRLIDAPAARLQRAHNVTGAEFVARVHEGHHGVVALDPTKWPFWYPVAVIPLGKGDPFQPDEFPCRVGPEETFSCAREVWFRFADHRLTWESENVSGQAVLNELYPELCVTLRLPAGNEGELVFEQPLFARIDGQVERVLSAA